MYNQTAPGALRVLDVKLRMKLVLLSLLPCSALAGGTVSVSIADLGAMNGVESLNFKGIYQQVGFGLLRRCLIDTNTAKRKGAVIMSV